MHLRAASGQVGEGNEGLLLVEALHVTHESCGRCVQVDTDRQLLLNRHLKGEVWSRPGPECSQRSRTYSRNQTEGFWWGENAPQRQRVPVRVHVLPSLGGLRRFS